MIRIYKGDSTDFADIGSIAVSIASIVDLTGFTGKFSFMGIDKTFPSSEIEQKRFTFNYTSEETAGFCLGENFGTFYLFDRKGRKAAIVKVLVEVLPACRYEVGVNGFCVSLDNAFDYNKMGGKPVINGVTVEGDWDGRHYGLQKIPAYDATSAYAPGEQVIYDEALWLCTAQTEAGEFDKAEWTRIGASVQVFENAESFPQTGTENVIYVDAETGLQYVWHDAAYVALTSDLSIYLLASAVAPAWHPGETEHLTVSFKSRIYRHPADWAAGESATTPPDENPRWVEISVLELLDGKVDKVAGKGLSQNDFTDADKTKLDGIETGANRFVLAPATAETLGGIKVGANLSIAADGTLSAEAVPADYAQVKEQVQQNTNDIAGINTKIPAQASAQNQLADKNFVNSSIATNTATFRGTYNLVSDLGLTVSATQQQVAAAIAAKLDSLVPPVVPENNDYVFVQVPKTDADPTVIDRVDRYKCTVTESGGVTTRVWDYEWSLNNSSFTSDQWAAINSGVTSGDVSKLAGIEAGAQVNAIDTVKVNGTALTPDANKAVDVTVPVKATAVPQIAGVADIGNSSKYASENHVHPGETRVAAYALPDECFPVTYTYDSTDHTVASNDRLEFREDIIASVPLVLVYYRVAVGANVLVCAFRQADLLYIATSTDITNLKFNGVSPVTYTSPTLRNDAVYVRDVQVATTAFVQTAVAGVPIRYSIGTVQSIISASEDTSGTETVYYGEATLLDRTINITRINVALDELRLTFPAAVSGKVRDFELRVEVGIGAAALTAPALVAVAPTGETITLENADGSMPTLADGTATAKGVTVLYFSETAAGKFLVKGEEMKEVE